MTKENIKIEDNFLEQEVFDGMRNIMTGKDFPWFFRERYYAMGKSQNVPVDELDNFQFTHAFYDSHAPQSHYMNQVDCILKLLQPVAILKIRANLLTRLPNIVGNSFHTDIMDLSEEKQKQFKTSIFYVNTNNGYTVFEDDTKVESVANRMLTFPANMKHTGTSCTDKQKRIIINFNYYKGFKIQ